MWSLIKNTIVITITALVTLSCLKVACDALLKYMDGKTKPEVSAAA